MISEAIEQRGEEELRDEGGEMIATNNRVRAEKRSSGGITGREYKNHSSTEQRSVQARKRSSGGITR